jgi:hypothetical protein
MRSNAIRYYPDANQYKPVSNNKNGINSMAFYNKPYKPARKSQVMKFPKIVAFK